MPLMRTMKPVAAEELSAPRRNLIEAARLVRGNAYAPYSRFSVGAALLTDSGEVFTGVNCENASLGGTICAERAALAAAVSAGHRRFSAVAVAAGEAVTPCGFCRQMLCEFGDMDVLAAGESGDVWTARLSALLPDAFDRFEPEDGRD